VKKRFTLIIGAAHCGTTALFRQLGSHPQVLPCRVKAPNFFTDDRKWALGLDWYRSLWDFREPDERVAIEASSDYARHPRVPCPAQRIASTPAGFRFVYLLRNPFDRVARHLARAWEEGRAAAPADPRALEEAIEVSRYAAQLEAYREYFRNDDFLLLSAEELEREPLLLLRRVCRFLEIDPCYGFPALREPCAEKPPRGWRARISERLRRRGRPRPGRPAPLDAAQRERVRLALRDDLARLEQEFGFDVGPWGLEG
jgi:hypothetical protein